jgi:hypothetical protein
MILSLVASNVLMWLWCVQFCLVCATVTSSLHIMLLLKQNTFKIMQQPSESESESTSLLFCTHPHTLASSSSSFYPPKLNSEYYWQGSDRRNCACWFLYVSTMAGFRQEKLCMLVSVCFHNLVTYAQRLQDLYSACLMFWMRTHTGPRFIVSSEDLHRCMTKR